MGDDKGFKVEDKRYKSGATDESDVVQEPSKEGDGFVMKDGQESPQGPAQIDFSTFVFSLATGALIHLGVAPDPETKKVQKNIPLAKQNIEILEMLSEKTKGNLNSDESQLMANLLKETRLQFVQAQS